MWVWRKLISERKVQRRKQAHLVVGRLSTFPPPNVLASFFELFFHLLASSIPTIYPLVPRNPTNYSFSNIAHEPIWPFIAMCHICFTIKALFQAIKFLSPNSPSFLGVQTSAYLTREPLTYVSCVPQRKILDTTSIFWTTIFDNMNILL